MAIVVYQCDVCDRTIEIPRQPKSIEVVSRCIITHGCRGKLFQTGLKVDYIRGQFPPRVDGLTDWVQRQILYTHRQTVAYDKWVVHHNLGTNPSIQVFVDRAETLLEMTPQRLEIIDNNTTAIYFTRGETGMAQFVSRTTASQTENIVAEEPATVSQITNSSELTIATLYTSGSITIQITYILSNGNILVKDYNVDNIPAILSPWVNYNKIMFKNHVYLVRSFNILIPEITNGIINNGASFYISSISNPQAGNFAGFKPIEAITLLAKDPYGVADKITTQYINLLGINTTLDATNNLFYNSGEFFASENIIQTVFPPIRQK